jgi:hypothetical protein
VIFPVGAVAACLLLSLLVWSRAGREAEPAARAPRSGMELLQAYRCRIPETKRIIVRGVEDNFSIAGSEPTRIREARRTTRTLSLGANGIYDQTEPDHWVIDHLEAPTRISRGLFVIGLKAVAGNDNDMISIGDLTDTDIGMFFETHPPDLAARPGWRRLGAVHYAEIGQIRLNGGVGRTGRSRPNARFPTLLDHVRASEGTALIDVQVQDDTSVDFIGLAVCEQPPGGKGMTYFKRSSGLPEGFASIACGTVPEGEHVCHPLEGDTPCATALPVACHRDREEPMPAVSATSLYWSGGALAFTIPTSASRFRTVGEVNAFCRAQFGKDWRIATYHDGGAAGEILARSDDRTPPGRVWVDIQDQPYATCWSR